MITVIYPTGTTINFPTATCLDYGRSSWRLMTCSGKQGQLVAVIQKGAGVTVSWTERFAVKFPRRRPAKPLVPSVPLVPSPA